MRLGVFSAARTYTLKRVRGLATCSVCDHVAFLGFGLVGVRRYDMFLLKVYWDEFVVGTRLNSFGCSGYKSSGIFLMSFDLVLL